MSKEFERLNHIADNEIDAYLRRSSIQFFECAVNLMLTHMSPEEVIQILEAQSEIINDFE